MAVQIRMLHISDDVTCFYLRPTEVDVSSVPVVGVVHIVNSMQCGGEYTLRGNAWTDSSLQFEGYERLEDPFKESVKKCTCASCLRLIYYIKDLC